MIFSFVLLLFYQLTTFVSSGEISDLNQYYQQLHTGQHEIQNYTGPLSSLTQFNSEKGQMVFIDDVYQDTFLNNELQIEVFDLKNFWFNKLSDQSSCPDTVLSENLDYIRYLYRLITMSYLFESLKIQNRVLSQLGGDKNICSLSYDKLFSKCLPKSTDMKNFKKRVYGKFVNEFSKISHEALFSSEIQGWLTLFQRSSIGTPDPIFSRLHDWCKTNEKNCNRLTLEEIKEKLGEFCEQDRQLTQTICNENDKLHGLSYIENAKELVKISNAFNLINVNGMGENCLRRFQKIFAPKEFHYRQLVNLYPTIYTNLKNENSRYLQGELFLPGALKEFDNKGLNDFLTALKPPVVAPEIVSKPAPVKTIVVKTIETKHLEKVEVKLTIVKPVDVIAPPVLLLSEFEAAVKKRDDEHLAKVELNMEKFQTDYEFTTKMISDLALPLRKFQARNVLHSMKTVDKLGTKEVPVSIKFIKFFIDTENHQGLYNIISELGNSFYVENDLKNQKVPVLVELNNDSSTKNKWQLSILGPQKKTEALTK